MLASHLIKKFVGDFQNPSARYLAEYCGVYGGTPGNLPDVGAPPSLGHAKAMAKTLFEWADRLDKAGIQVHQEGAIARFEAAANAPVFGRHPKAAEARAKTSGFYRNVLKAAVQAARARSFNIPAALAQGYVVASHEALEAARTFRAALKAAEDLNDPNRPELAEEAERAKGIAMRAVSMHATACAEAVACGEAATFGPWLRVATKFEDVPTGPFVVGVEVVGGNPVLDRLHANLDPQHGGGVFGLGAKPPENPLAACDAAMHMVLGGLRLPENTRFVTNRMDPDALVAAMILAGRIPATLLAEPTVQIRIAELAVLDNGNPTETWEWTPGVPNAQTVSDHKLWGVLGQLTLSYVRGEATLEDLTAGALAVLLGELSSWNDTTVIGKARDTHKKLMARTGNLQFQVDGPIAVGVDFPVGPGVFSHGYAIAPVVVLKTSKFPFRGQDPGLKYTVAVCRETGPKGPAFVKAFREKIGKHEQGWGGPGTITGSPFAGPSKVSLEVVLQAVKEAVREADFPVQVSSTSGSSGGMTTSTKIGDLSLM